MFVTEFFILNEEYQDHLHDMKPDFGYNGFGEFLFYRTYSRLKANGSNETWAECVIRVINGCMTIRKDWYVKNHIPWDETYWQEYAFQMAQSMFRMEWLPPGRGLWAMGTPFIYERGSMALYNCAFTYYTSHDLADDIAWMMDSLMLGVGVGFEPTRDKLTAHQPAGHFKHVITDDREGWVNSVRLLVLAFTQPGVRMPHFIYDYIRKENLPIKGFGGVSSGPGPLIKLHEQITACFTRFFADPSYDLVRLKADIGNLVGVCVVAGNVRRSAEIMLGEVTDPIFMDLKNYELNPERASFGWMSNNSAKLFEDEHYEMLGEVARRVITRGEPGIVNIRNFPFGRLGRENENLRLDPAKGINPCGEITLEHRETCNVVETLPTRCFKFGTQELDHEVWLKACEYAATYATSVSLLPTHQPSTNRVVARNRRIGVGIIDYTGWRVLVSQHKVIKYLRQGYETVRRVSHACNAEAGVPSPIKVTTIKPGGTVPKLAGRTPGIGYPTFRETLRAVRVRWNHPTATILKEAGVPNEPEKYDPENTGVFGFPILQGPSKSAEQVTLWEQANNLVTVQSEWSDNAVSNTLYFKPKWKLDEVITNEGEYLKRMPWFESNKDNWKVVPRTKIDGTFESANIYKFDPQHEEDDLEFVLSAIVPKIKSVSLLPHTPQGVYDQMPEQKLSPARYGELLAQIKPIDWSQLTGSDGIDERYCTGDACTL